MDGEGGGGTKRVEIISRNGNLVVNCHNNDGTIDCATISGEGDLVKFEEGVNVPIDRREQKESPGTEGSKANAPHVVADALRASEEFLGKDRNWTFPADGKLFEKALPSLKAQLPEIADVLESKAQQGGLNEVNKFLRDKGFTIQLEGNMGPFDIAAASILDMNVRWKEKGTAVTLTLSDTQKSVDAVSMAAVKEVYKSPDAANPIIEVETNTGDQVFMTKYEGEIPKDSTSLFRLVTKISRGKQVAEGYKGARFPMVDFNDSGDIKELLGARTTAADGDPAEISQAIYQHRLRMNEVGARAQAAAAVLMSKGIDFNAPRPVVIDGSFLVWFERNGVIPFSAHITEKHMKKPENLD